VNTKEQLLIINGKDKSNSVASFQFSNGKCNVVYTSSPRVYSYNSSNVRILKLQKSIDPNSVMVTVKGSRISGAEQLLDFGDFYRIVRSGRKDLSYPKQDVQLEKNCLGSSSSRTLFNYFKETAAAVSLVTEKGVNILSRQYEKITTISEETALASYMDSSVSPKKRTSPPVLIYPFGLNQSQKVAVEHAFSSQISIIQGPPGTGKTQTILNIVANAVRNGKTVAVVSNNNAATLNVAEKLEKKGLSFLTAFLGNLANKASFLDAQSGSYPNMSAWVLSREEKEQLDIDVKKRSEELNDMLHAKNHIAELEQEFLELKPEQHYFGEYYATVRSSVENRSELSGLSSQKILALWLEYEHLIESNDKLGFLRKLAIIFRFNRAALTLFTRSPELVIPYLQKQFYITKSKELIEEKSVLEKKLDNYSFDEKMSELEQKSLRLFRAELAQHYNWRGARKVFESKEFRSASVEFNEEYPVVLSTTYSIKGTLSIEHIYDYLIIDEASQADLATGVLAFSCARNIVIVGDQKQLPHVLTDVDIRTANKIWSRYFLDEKYQFSQHSLLSSAAAVWSDVPSVLLREHYRCHPKIAGFFNQKFYGGELVVMTKDNDEPDVLTMYRTAEGNHARNHFNQRQIDVIKTEILPNLERKRYKDIGIITPYRDQVKAISSQLGEHYEVATVHKFQGREKDAIVLTSVDNVITDFVDDAHMLNVAVSRAVKSLSVVVSSDARNDKTNYGDLAKYIEYNNCEIISSTVFSVFDLLYKGYAQQRKQYLRKYKRISVYDSENLMHTIIEQILKKPEFAGLDCAVRVSLVTLIKSYDLLDAAESKYVRNPLTHTDFLLFDKMDKSPILAIEVDGTRYHAEGGRQHERDKMKNSIFEKYGIPLLRMRTDGSNERMRIEEQLRKLLN